MFDFILCVSNKNLVMILILPRTKLFFVNVFINFYFEFSAILCNLTIILTPQPY